MKKNKQELSTQDIKHLAFLSQLQLTDEELEKIGAQLNETLDYVHNLNELNTVMGNSSPQTPENVNTWREDQIDNSRMFTQEEALKNAKNKKNGYFEVKRIL